MRFNERMRRWLETTWRRSRKGALHALDLLLPAVCAACEQPLPPGAGSEPGMPPRGWCRACAAGLPGIRAIRCPRCGERAADAKLPCPACLDAPPAYDHCIALADYARPLDSLVLAIKFGRQSALGAPLGRLLAQACREGWPSAQMPFAVVPVPLAPGRLAERGFNQAALLAAPVAASFRQSLRRDLLYRRRETPAASLLDASERRSMLHDAFGARNLPHGATIVVVDDVMTTGTTLQAAAQALKVAGAATVIVCVACRTPPGSRYDRAPSPPASDPPRC